MNDNQSVSVVQKKRRNIYFFRAKMCAPSLELLPPLLLVPSVIVSKNPGGDDESKSEFKTCQPLEPGGGTVGKTLFRKFEKVSSLFPAHWFIRPFKGL